MTSPEICPVPVGGSLGARVDGIDVRSLDDAALDRLTSAVHDHLVIFLPGQQLDDDEHLRFSSRLGTKVSVHPISVYFDRDEPIVEVIEDDADRPPSAENWHTDVTFAPNPPGFGVLLGEVIPEAGGDTMWSNQYLAYEQLSPVIRDLVGGMVARHTPGRFLDGLRNKMGAEVADQVRPVLPEATHPVVITHPVTGRRALYVNRGFTTDIEGLGPIESAGLLRLLVDHAEQPRFTVRWRWSPGDLAIWDERATMHFAIGDHFPAHRRMRRCTVDIAAVPAG